MAIFLCAEKNNLYFSEAIGQILPFAYLMYKSYGFVKLLLAIIPKAVTMYTIKRPFCIEDLTKLSQ